MKKQLINEAERLQQLAGINEMKVNAPRNIIDNLPEDIDELLFGMTDMEVSDDNDEGDLIEGVWDANEIADDTLYGEAAETFVKAHQFISDKGGKITIPGTPEVTFTALPGGDIGYSFVVEF
jgi:hypothetical protein